MRKRGSDYFFSRKPMFFHLLSDKTMMSFKSFFIHNVSCSLYEAIALHEIKTNTSIIGRILF